VALPLSVKTLKGKIMKKRILSIVFALILSLSLLTAIGCGGGASGTNLKVSFKSDGVVVKEIDIKKGGTLQLSDLPKIEKVSSNFSYDWAINLANPINEDATIEMLYFTKGVKLVENGKNYKITGLELENPNKKPTTLVLPTYYKGKLVTLIEAQAFGSYAQEAYPESTEITTVVLPEYLETISEQAFAYLRKLKSISFPNTIKFIGYAAFVACPFETLDLPESLTLIGERAFSGTFKEVKIPSQLTTLPSFAITSRYLETLIIPKGLQKINDGGIWPPEPIYDENKKPIGYNEFKIFYEGDIFDWEAFLPNVSDVDVANIIGDGVNDDFDKLISLHSSYDVVEMATIYLYSEEEPTFDLAHRDNKYWKYDENGEIYVWDDPEL